MKVILTKIPTYIINLKRDTNRKEHMLKILQPYKDSLLDIEWVNAIEGKLLTEQQIESDFNRRLAYKRYGRSMNLGEIGCVLSHFKCYEHLLASSSEYALILEDDITILNELYWKEEFNDCLNTDKPVILFLSGDYWYHKLKRVDDKLSIASVYDAVGAYAYAINKSAAKLILEKNPIPSFVSDNWSIYRSQGVLLKAVYPYMIDANIENIESSVKQYYWGEIRKHMSFPFVLKSYWNALIKRYLLYRGCFVSKIR